MMRDETSRMRCRFSCAALFIVLGVLSTFPGVTMYAVGHGRSKQKAWSDQFHESMEDMIGWSDSEMFNEMQKRREAEFKPMHLQWLGIGLILFGLALIAVGTGLCIWTKRSANTLLRERAAQAPSGPTVCGLLPGQPAAGNYMDQNSPHQQSEYSVVPGSDSSTNHKSQPAYPQQSGATGFSQHPTPSAPPTEAMNSLPSYNDVVHGPAGKFDGLSKV